MFSMLAMKRHNASELPMDEAFAVIVAYDRTAVYVKGIGTFKGGHLIHPQLKGVKRLEYASCADIYDDGWRVD